MCRLLPLTLALLATGSACGPGLEEGSPDVAPAADRGVVADGKRDGHRDTRAPVDQWVCREYFATNYDHVQAGRAQNCGGDACTTGSNEDLGLYNVVANTWVRETKKGYFEKGRCP